MILSPDDHRSLQAIDGKLAAGEPHLAAMFKIFSKLNAEEPPPPTEDLIVARPPVVTQPADQPSRRDGWRGRRQARAQAARARAARARAGSRPGAGAARRPGTAALSGARGVWGPVAAIAVPMVLLVTLIVVVFFGLASTVKCQAPAASQASSAKTALAVPGAASLAACQQSTGNGGTAGSSARG
jgi:hypothetical protein